MDATPLDTLEELWKWVPPTNKGSVKELSNYSNPEGRAEVMLCHDMKGGYLEEESLSGVCVPTDSHPYVFLHWWQIDIFCYFSHHLVTVPPIGWTNAAHAHGVHMMGTFITEWDEGKKICTEMLSSTENIDRTVAKLVELALEWKFEGWLINIENLLEVEEVPKMCEFLGKLTDNMREAVPHAKVIWYDSVTRVGELKWQNALNDENKIFYDACDGIYLNYNWTDAHLLESVRQSEGRGKQTVYAGIDCFARGCAGGWDCHSSFSQLSSHGLSVALFAPGWIAETMPEADPIANGMKFWSLLSPYTFSRPIREIPFSTDFSVGFKDDAKWWCLDAISLQPHLSQIEEGATPLKERSGLYLPEMATYRIFSLNVLLTPKWRIRVQSSFPVSVLLNDRVLVGVYGVYKIDAQILVTSLHIATLTTDTVVYSIEVEEFA